MKLERISEDEFEEYAKKNSEITFYQTKYWANLKKKNNWRPHYVGLKKENQILAASLILSKEVPFIKKNMFYAPRGFLIDYKDKDLLKEFTAQIKDYAKKENAIFIKIDPYVEYKERDNNGEIVEGGNDNSITVENLKELGYKHFGFNLMQDTLQPRWMHVIETENKSLEEVEKDMESKTRQILRKNERSGIKTREITKEEIPIFKDIMQHTSDRREFIDRPLSYYENMWDALHDAGILKILIAEIDFVEFEKNTQEELEKNKQDLKSRIYKKEHNILKMNEKKYEQHNKQNEKEIDRLEKQLENIKGYKEQYGDKKILGGILFLIYQKMKYSLKIALNFLHLYSNFRPYYILSY